MLWPFGNGTSCLISLGSARPHVYADVKGYMGWYILRGGGWFLLRAVEGSAATAAAAAASAIAIYLMTRLKEKR